MMSILLAFTFFSVLCFARGQANDEILSVVSSSKFRMDLSPTPDRLNVTAATKVELAIKTVLLVSSETTIDFQSVFDIDIVLQKIEWGVLETDKIPSTVLQFEVHMAFFKDNALLPSTFALDSLIVRTFSQPSSKSMFFENLEVAEESSLSQVEFVDIELADGEAASGTQNEDSSSISDLDLILIFASILMFFGVVYVVCQYQKDKARILELHYRWSQRSKKRRTSIQEPTMANETTEDSGNIIHETSSVVSGSFVEDGGDLDGSIDGQATKATVSSSERRETPPISPCSSFPMSPIETFSLTGSPFTSRDDATTTEGSIQIEKLSSLVLRDPPPDHLGSQLLSLPLMDQKIQLNVSQSSMSTQEDYMRSLSEFSASTGSLGDLSSIFKVMLSRGQLPQPSSVSSNSTTSSEKTKRANNCFDNNWSDAKKKALESGDESSTEDVFRIDMETKDGVEDNISSTNGLSVVSEWMRSIHVVESCSEGTSTSAEDDESSNHHLQEDSESDEESIHGSVDISTLPV